MTLGIVRVSKSGFARVLAFGRIDDVEILSRLEPAGLQDRYQNLVAGARIGRRFQRDELPLAQDPRQHGGGFANEPQVRFAVFAQRCRHADDDRVGLAQNAGVRGPGEPRRTGQRGDALLRNMADVGNPARDRVELGAIDVEADHRHSGLVKRKRDGQTDISQPDDGDRRGSAFDAVDELILAHGRPSFARASLIPRHGRACMGRWARV